MVPSGSIPQAKHGRSRILYRKPGPRTQVVGSGGVEAKGKKVRSYAVAHAPAVRIFYGRAMPQGLPFPLGFISHSLGRKESKGKKVRSYAVAHAPAG